MDSGSRLNVSEKCEVICSGEVNLGYLSSVDCNGKLPKARSEMENTAFLLLLPVTPDMPGEKKVGDSQIALDSNTKLLHKKSCCLDYGGAIFHTPIAEIVDPSSSLHVKKEDPDECRTIAARSLDFGSAQQGNDSAVSDDEMVESVYENLLNVILSNEIEGAPSDDNGCKTPTPRLTGIAETCPGAPMKKKTRKKVNRDSSLCRKLEF